MVWHTPRKCAIEMCNYYYYYCYYYYNDLGRRWCRLTYFVVKRLKTQVGPLSSNLRNISVWICIVMYFFIYNDLRFSEGVILCNRMVAPILWINPHNFAKPPILLKLLPPYFTEVITQRHNTAMDLLNNRK